MVQWRAWGRMIAARTLKPIAAAWLKRVAPTFVNRRATMLSNQTNAAAATATPMYAYGSANAPNSERNRASRNTLAIV